MSEKQRPLVIKEGYQPEKRGYQPTSDLSPSNVRPPKADTAIQPPNPPSKDTPKPTAKK